MYRPVYIKGDNWGAFESFEYSFEPGKIIAIQGKNLNFEENSKSNGSGKSTFFSAPSYAITSDPLKKVNKKSLVRYGQKEAYLEMFLRNDITNGSILIKRTIPVRGSEKVELEINNIKQEYPTVDSCNKAIIEEIGINSNDLTNFFLVSKEKWKSFFSSSDADKKALIGKFSKADIIDGIEDDIKADIALENDKMSILDSQISNENIKKSNLQIKLSAYTAKKETLAINLSSSTEKESFDTEKNRLKTSVQAKIDDTMAKKAMLPSEISKSSLKIDQIRAQIDSVNKTIEGLKINYEDAKKRYFDASLVKFDHLYAEFKADKDAQMERKANGQVFVRNINVQLSQTRNLVADVEAKIRGVVTCPLCTGQFSLQNNLSVDDLKKSLSEHQTTMSSLSATVAKYEKAISDIDAKLSEYEQKEREISLKEDENRKNLRAIASERDIYLSNIQKHETEVNSLTNDIRREENLIESNKKLESSYKQEIKTYEAKLIEIDKMEYEDKSDEVKKQIEDTNKLIVEVENDISTIDLNIESIISQKKQIEDNIFEMKAWIIRFKNFYSNLVNKALGVISNQMNVYLNLFGTDLRVEFEGYKVKSDGTLSEKLTPYITRKNGMEEVDYWALSGGEKGRLELASILANSTLINSSTPNGKGLDFTAIDEVLESVDGHSLTNILDSIQGIDKTALFVTHVDIDDSFKKILVKKENSVSRLEVI